MENSKLIFYLKALSKDELKEFGNFVENSSIKNSAYLIAFFKYLKGIHPLFPEKKIQKEYLVKKLFAQNGKSKQVDNLTYKLTVLLDQFLIQEELKGQTKEQDFLLLQALKKRKLDKFFFAKIKKMEEGWKEHPGAGIEQLHDSYRLQKMRLLHPNYSKETDMTLGPNTLLSQIDQYYFLVKLYWTLCGYHTSNYFVNEDEHLKERIFPIDNIIDFASHQNFEETPQIKLLGQIHHNSTTPNFKNYPQLKENFFNLFDSFNKKEKIDLVSFLTQICYQNYRQGSIGALHELFELNCFAIEKKVYLEDGYIASDIFQNIVNVACAVKELDWTEKFIETNAPFLKKAERADLVTLCTVILQFNKGEYTKVLEELSMLKFHNTYYSVQARAIKLQAFYELEDSNLFFDLTKSFSMFLTRNKSMTDSTKKSFSNFINFIKRLQKLKNEYRPNVEKLIEKIKLCDQLVYKNWLLTKAQHLSAKKGG